MARRPCRRMLCLFLPPEVSCLLPPNPPALEMGSQCAAAFGVRWGVQALAQCFCCRSTGSLLLLERGTALPARAAAVLQLCGQD